MPFLSVSDANMYIMEKVRFSLRQCERYFLASLSLTQCEWYHCNIQYPSLASIANAIAKLSVNGPLERSSCIQVEISFN